jgi:hypothetical protein
MIKSIKFQHDVNSSPKWLTKSGSTSPSAFKIQKSTYQIINTNIINITFYSKKKKKEVYVQNITTSLANTVRKKALVVLPIGLSIF